MQFKKGDRVEWDWQDNQTHYGTIQRKAGDMYKVVEDGHPEELWTIHNARLRSTNRPLPQDTIKTPADIYEVRMFKNVGTGTAKYLVFEFHAPGVEPLRAPPPLHRRLARAAVRRGKDLLRPAWRRVKPLLGR